MRKVILFVSFFLLVAALVFGYLAWQDFKRAVILVEWSTASELDTAGFNLLRSDTKEGPFEKINSQLVPASPDPLTGGDYTYRDEGVEAGRIYYYQLEDVGNSGSSSRYGPIEVEAERGGSVQLIISMALAIVGVMGLIGTRERSSGVQNV